MRATSILLVASLLFAAACSGREGATWAGTMDTLPDGRVVVTNPAEGAWSADEAWRVIPEIRIGAADGTGPEVLGNISTLAEDAGGRIWALESQDQQFKVFGRDGAFIRTVGRKGGGPGEMRQAAGVAVRSDGNLLVVDMQGARISLFDTAGTYLHGFPLSGGYTVLPWPGGIDTAGYLYHVAPDPSTTDFQLVFVRYDSAMTPLDTIVPPRSTSTAFFEHASNGGRMRASVPFSPGLRMRLTPAGDFWFVNTGTYELFRRSARGDTLRVVTKPFQRVAVTGAEKDSAIAGLKWFTDQGGSVDRGRIPDEKPAVQDFYVARDGYLWVNAVQADTALQRRAFEIFDPEGRFLGAIELPFDLMSYPPPLIFGDHIIGMTQDDDGVPYLVRARIERSARARDQVP